MCLNKLEKFKTTGVGWKVVLITEKKYVPPLRFCCQDSYKKRGWNIDAKDNPLSFYDNDKKETVFYPTGYHIFVNKKDAKRFMIKHFEEIGCKEIVKKVRYKTVVATGTQTLRARTSEKQEYVHAKVIVAKKFKFIRR